MRPNTLGVLILVIVAVLLPQTSCYVTKYDKFSLASEFEYKEKTAMYSLNDTPSGSRHPLVTVSLSFAPTDQEATKNKCRSQKCLISFLFIPNMYMTYLDLGKDPKHPAIQCCEQSPCGPIGHAKFSPPAGVDAQRAEAVFEADDKGTFSASVKHYFNVTQSGVHTLIILNCKLNGPGSVTFSGDISWLNPYGYLPANEYGLLPFHGVVAGLYLIVAIIFSVLCVIYRKKLLSIQKAILGVIVIGIVENAAWWFFYISVNKSGDSNFPGLVFVIIINVFKQTVSRVLVLVVSMGLGVVKFTIRKSVKNVALLASLYFLCFTVFQILDKRHIMSKTTEISKQLLLTFLIPVAILDTTFYWWMFLSLIRTIQLVKMRRQIVKLQLYKNFFAVLAITVVLCVIVVLYQGFATIMNQLSWQTEWVWKGFWEFLFFVVLTAVAFLWRPTTNNTRYGYAEVYDYDDEVEMQPRDESSALEQVTVTAGTMKKRPKETSPAPVKKAPAKKKKPLPPKDEIDEVLEKTIALVISDDEDSAFTEKERNKMD